MRDCGAFRHERMKQCVGWPHLFPDLQLIALLAFFGACDDAHAASSQRYSLQSGGLCQRRSEYRLIRPPLDLRAKSAGSETLFFPGDFGCASVTY
jgi:hypothetical protein